VLGLLQCVASHNETRLLALSRPRFLTTCVPSTVGIICYTLCSVLSLRGKSMRGHVATGLGLYRTVRVVRSILAAGLLVTNASFRSVGF
jgi:hypothetical protein